MTTTYTRTINGHTSTVTRDAARSEIDNAQMGPGKRSVKTMTCTNGLNATIHYRNGDSVVITTVEILETPEQWSGTRSKPAHMHRFENDRAVCNTRIRPNTYLGAGVEYRTRGELQSSEYADLYTYCTACAED